MRVLDMCTGSGCIIISILKNTTNVDGAACDISKQALNVAKENARLNGVFVDFERSDLFEHVDEMYDVIVSNPPYIRSDEIPHLMPGGGSVLSRMRPLTALRMDFYFTGVS